MIKIKGDPEQMISESEKLAPQILGGKNMKFRVLILGDGFGYASGFLDWFDGLLDDVEIIDQIPSHCGRCKALTAEADLIENRCNSCQEDG